MIYFEDKLSPAGMEEVFGPEGCIAEALVDYESRVEQVDMAKAVAEAIEGGRHFAVEAGTGVGKSFAYLVPAVGVAAHNKGKVVVSTYTITLQEQLINKDIPFLADVLGYDFQACLAKGRNNYLCLRRLEYAKRKNAGLFDEVSGQLAELASWAKETKDGSLSDMDSSPSAAVWDAVKSEHGNCKGRKCGHFKDCFYWKARRKLETADIIIANHALLFSDLVLKKEAGVGVLGDYKNVIIDEAHNIEAVAEDHFGINVSSWTFTFLFSGLFNSRTKRGTLAGMDADAAKEQLKICEKAAKLFFRAIEAWFDNIAKAGSERCPKNVVDDCITEELKNLRGKLNQLAQKIEDEDDVFELTRAIDRLRGLEIDIKKFLEQSDDDQVYWVEVSGDRRSSVRLRSGPVKVAENIKEVLFDNYRPVILTSATLTCGAMGQKEGFAFFADRVGLADYQAMQLGSPFDHSKQVRLFVEKSMPDPRDDSFSGEAVEAIKKYLEMTDGKAFVLFTSYKMLKETAEMMRGWCGERGFELLEQGGGVDRGALLKQFKADMHSVLFGTDSFWQGVDVPGESLSNVIIVKLPFAVPNHPLIAGKIEKIRADGGNPFFDFQLPGAIIKFKQGFGRLIRSKSDEGIVAILDSRIVTKNYGRNFLQAIPKCKMG